MDGGKIEGLGAEDHAQNYLRDGEVDDEPQDVDDGRNEWRRGYGRVQPCTPNQQW